MTLLYIIAAYVIGRYAGYVSGNIRRNEEIQKILDRQRAFLEHHLRILWWKNDRDKDKAMFAMLEEIRNKLIIKNIWVD